MKDLGREVTLICSPNTGRVCVMWTPISVGGLYTAYGDEH